MISATSWTPSADLTDGPYKWWVFGVNGQNLYSFPSVRTEIYFGGRTEVLTPVGDTTDTTPTFSWRAVSGAARYSLWVNRIDVSFGVIRETDIEQTQFTPAVALPAGTYRVWVRAVSSKGEFAPWSVVKDFQITEVTQFTPDWIQHRLETIGMDDAVPVMLLSELSPETEAHETSAAQRLKSRISTPTQSRSPETDPWTQEPERSESPPIPVQRTLSSVFHPVPDSGEQSTNPFHVTIDQVELDDAWSLDPEMLFLDHRTAMR